MAGALGVGSVFAGYRIERLLGAGGTGEVYLARDRGLPRGVALKLLARPAGSLMRWNTGNYDEAADMYRQALALYRAIGNRLGEANALDNLGCVCMSTGDHAQAADLQGQALTLFRDVGDRRGEAQALTTLAYVHRKTGAYEQSADLLEEALALCRDIGNRRGEAHALTALGYACSDRSRLRGPGNRGPRTGGRSAPAGPHPRPGHRQPPRSGRHPRQPRHAARADRGLRAGRRSAPAGPDPVSEHRSSPRPSRGTRRHRAGPARHRRTGRGADELHRGARVRARSEITSNRLARSTVSPAAGPGSAILPRR